MKTIHLTRRHAELLLAGVIIARATSYLFSKLILEGMGMFNLLGVRFALAFALLFMLFFSRLRAMSGKTFIAGVIMGGMYFLVVTAELSGLKRMSSGNASFLVNTAIVLVPLLQAIIKKRFPHGKVILSVLLCMLGVAILTLGGRVRFAQSAAGDVVTIENALGGAGVVEQQGPGTGTREITSCSIPIHFENSPTWFRLQIRDAEGRYAWSNPIKIER